MPARAVDGLYEQWPEDAGGVRRRGSDGTDHKDDRRKPETDHDPGDRRRCAFVDRAEDDEDEDARGERLREKR